MLSKETLVTQHKNKIHQIEEKTRSGALAQSHYKLYKEQDYEDLWRPLTAKLPVA